MSKQASTFTSLGAILSSLLALGCCLPLGFLGAAGAAGAAVLVGRVRPWLLALSVFLLGLGFFQIYRGARCGLRQSRINMIVLGLATLLVVLFALFPQTVAGFLADHLTRSAR